MVVSGRVLVVRHHNVRHQLADGVDHGRSIWDSLLGGTLSTARFVYLNLV